MLLLTLSFLGVAKSAPEETQSVFSLEYGGLIIGIQAPIQSHAGETISVTVKSQAVTEIFVKYIHVKIYGVLNATHNITLSTINHLENSSLTSLYEIQYNITISNNISPGLTYGLISYEWELMGLPQKIPSSGFALTYIRNIDLEELQLEYDTLNATHQSLLQDYAELETSLDKELDSTRNLLYIFIATTVVASITVIVLLMRKPKKIWI
jgi:hypothetical protein